MPTPDSPRLLTYTPVRAGGFEIKVYNLQMNAYTFSGSTICLLTRGSCDTFEEVCTNSGKHGAPGTCRYSFADKSE